MRPNVYLSVAQVSSYSSKTDQTHNTMAPFTLQTIKDIVQVSSAIKNKRPKYMQKQKLYFNQIPQKYFLNI